MRRTILGILLFLALLLVPGLASAPVQAAAVMVPTEGIVGTFVAVSGLTDGATYVIKWDSITFRSGVVPTGGTISFNVGDAPRGPHSVVVENPTATVVLTTTFTVIPSIDISPYSGPSDTIVTVVGRGFAAWEPNIRVTYDTVIITPGILANGSGSWIAQFIAPSSSRGYHAINAFGTITPPYELFDRSFNITPLIMISPSSGCISTLVTITGTGFAAIEPSIEINFDDQIVRSGIVSSADGKWSTTFNVPSAGRGIHTVDASGASTAKSTVPDTVFTVMASAFIDPTVGNVGDIIRIIGKGFASSETGISISYDSRVVRSNITADADGNWTTSLVIPASSNGIHEISAFGSITTSLNCAGTTLSVQPKITLSPQEGNVGDIISLTGSGFSSQSSLITTYSGDPVVSGISTDATGSFSTNFKTPGGKSGKMNIVVSDARGVRAEAVFIMETTPPPIPQLLFPPDGGRVGFVGSSRIDFDWTNVSDPSGVYYTLEISPQSNFPLALIRITNLNSSQYSLSEAESLPYGEYYWRVRAIDGAGNTSAWTNSSQVKISYMTVEIFILIIVSVVIVIVLAATMPVVLRRKKM